MDVKTSSSNELHHILERLVAFHRNLADLLREEYAHMAAVDVKAIAEAAHSKEVLLSEIWNHEQLRIRAAENLAVALGLAPAEATLLALAERLPKAEADRLRSARTALNLLVTEARDLNARNMSFANESLARIEEMKRNALGLGKTAIKENYSNSGVRQPIAEQGGRLLSTEA